jgi:hypothetical protein
MQRSADVCAQTLFQSSVADPDDFLTGSGSDFRISPNLDPDLNKFSAKFIREIFLADICSKSIVWIQKVKKQRFQKYLWLFHTPKKLI